MSSVNNTNYGKSSLQNNIGDNNSAFGAYAAYHNLDGSCNTVVGSNALFYNTTGDNNTSIGLPTTTTTIPTSSQLGYTYKAVLQTDIALGTGLIINLLSISLTPGIYIVNANLGLFCNAGNTGIYYFYVLSYGVSISTSSTEFDYSSAQKINNGEDKTSATAYSGPANFGLNCSRIITVTTDTTIYLNSYTLYLVYPPAFFYMNATRDTNISAIRIG